MFIKRELQKELLSLSRKYPVVTVTGPRQSGKTTLIRHAFPALPFYSMEDPDVRELALADPRAFLGKTAKGAVLDEIQQAPELLSYLQGMIDKPKNRAKFILSGSQQFELTRHVTQSLAGRTALLRLLPLSIDEIENGRSRKTSVEQYMLKGFYPRIYDKRLNPTKAYKAYFETYIQRDLRQLIHVKDLRLFRKFVRLCAGRIGGLTVASSLANDVGVSIQTIQSWLSVLEASYIIYFLEPYYENIGKRLIKSPKLYFCDVGLAAYLLGIENKNQIDRDPLRGRLVENLVIMEIVKKRYNQGLDANVFFYRDNHENEVDLIYKSGNSLVPAEVKAASTFHKDFLKGLRYIKKILPHRIKKGYVIYTGTREQEAGEGFELINFKKARHVV